MNIIYESGNIIDVQINHPTLGAEMTLTERLDIFGCSSPDGDTLIKLRALEKGETSSVDELVDAIELSGKITTQRATELKSLA